MMPPAESMTIGDPKREGSERKGWSVWRMRLWMLWWRDVNCYDRRLWTVKQGAFTRVLADIEARSRT
jgi:hypothetical protein